MVAKKGVKMLDNVFLCIIMCVALSVPLHTVAHVLPRLKHHRGVKVVAVALGKIMLW